MVAAFRVMARLTHSLPRLREIARQGGGEGGQGGSGSGASGALAAAAGEGVEGVGVGLGEVRVNFDYTLRAAELEASMHAMHW